MEQLTETFDIETDCFDWHNCRGCSHSAVCEKFLVEREIKEYERKYKEKHEEEHSR